jgi:hypothetical protein
MVDPEVDDRLAQAVAQAEAKSWQPEGADLCADLTLVAGSLLIARQAEAARICLHWKTMKDRLALLRG